MEFTVQKLHPALQPGRRLTIVGSNAPAFSFQGAWDGGCALHATAMAVAMLGHLSDPLRVPLRRRGPEAEFWNKAWPFYLSGIRISELETLVWELNWGLSPVVFEGSHVSVLRFCESEVLRQRPVILVWRELRRAALHAVIAVGAEGTQTGRVFEGHTLLIIDSAEAEPVLAVHNARLTWTMTGYGKRSPYAHYVTTYEQRKVVLVSAMSIRQAPSVRSRKTKPP